MLLQRIVLACALLAASCFAKVTTITSASCATKRGTTSVNPVPTSSTSTSLKSTTTITVPIIVTDTITPATQTVKSTTVIYVTSTTTESKDTTSTTTLSDQTLQVVEYTVTTIVTTYSTTGTSTVAVPSDFQPVQDTYNGYPGSRKRRIGLADHPHGAVEKRNERAGHLEARATKYPTLVTCTTSYITETTKTTSVPGTTTTTTIPAPTTTTKTVSQTRTKLYTVYSGNTVIVSTTTTMTHTTSTPYYITSTQTVSTEATTYEACSPTNIIGPEIGGLYISDLQQTGDIVWYGPNDEPGTWGNIETAYDCCALCMSNYYGCQAAAAIAPGTPDRRCHIWQGDSGPQSANPVTFDLTSDVQDLYLTNGATGYWLETSNGS